MYSRFLLEDDCDIILAKSIFRPPELRSPGLVSIVITSSQPASEMMRREKVERRGCSSSPDATSFFDNHQT